MKKLTIVGLGAALIFVSGYAHNAFMETSADNRIPLQYASGFGIVSGLAAFFGGSIDLLFRPREVHKVSKLSPKTKELLPQIANIMPELKLLNNIKEEDSIQATLGKISLAKEILVERRNKLQALFSPTPGSFADSSLFASKQREVNLASVSVSDGSQLPFSNLLKNL